MSAPSGRPIDPRVNEARTGIRVLLLSHHHPASGAIGAMRVNSFAHHLEGLGCDVRQVRGRTEPPGTGSGAPSSASRRRATKFIRGVLGGLIRQFVAIPDRAVRDVPQLLRDSRSLNGWAPQVIVASGPPFSVYVAAWKLAKEWSIPWIADYRDLWSLGSYYSLGRFRHLVDQCTERQLLRSCSAVVTVSAPLARDMSNTFGVPTHVVLNGADPLPESTPASTSSPSANELTIVHTGTIYPGKRDPLPLLRTLHGLSQSPLPVRVVFVGPPDVSVQRAVADLQLEDRVTIMGSVPRSESLAIQAQADVLLLLMWNHPGEEGVYTGKLFDYLAAGRPILMIGYPDGVAADLIRSRSAGFVAPTVEDVSAAIAHWRAEKERTGRVAPLASDVLQGLTRADSARNLLAVIDHVAGH